MNEVRNSGVIEYFDNHTAHVEVTSDGLSLLNQLAPRLPSGIMEEVFLDSVADHPRHLCDDERDMHGLVLHEDLVDYYVRSIADPTVEISGIFQSALERVAYTLHTASQLAIEHGFRPDPV